MAQISRICSASRSPFAVLLCMLGGLIFIHHQCWEVLPFCRFQRQRCIKILRPKDPDFYTPLALKTAKGSTSQHWWCIKISLPYIPSDTKLLLTKTYFEIIIFEKLRISRVISGKGLSFLEIFRVQIPSKLRKINSQGIIFAIISCQRVCVQ